MAILFIGFNWNAGFNVNNCPLPVNAAVGDLLILNTIGLSFYSTGGPLAGLTSITPGDSGYGNGTGPGGLNYGHLYWKFATSADITAGVLYGTESVEYNFYAITAWRNVDIVTPIQQYTTNHGATGIDIRAIGGAGLVPNTIAVMIGNQDDAYAGGFTIVPVIVQPATKIYRDWWAPEGPGPCASIAASYTNLASATSLLDQHFTLNSSYQWGSAIIFLNPVISGGGGGGNPTLFACNCTITPDVFTPGVRLASAIVPIAFPLSKLLESGATETPNDLSIRTKAGSRGILEGRFLGYLRVRSINGSMYFTAAERASLLTFYQSQIAGGSLTFQADFDNTNITKNYRFTKAPRFTPVGDKYSVDMELAIVP